MFPKFSSLFSKFFEYVSRLCYRGLNFTNVLRAAFTHGSCARRFLCLSYRFVLYWRKTVGAKAARRTLVKLIPGHLSRQAAKEGKLCERVIRVNREENEKQTVEDRCCCNSSGSIPLPPNHGTLLEWTKYWVL
jgi:hypothetical protein